MTPLDLGASLVLGHGGDVSLRGTLHDVFDARRYDFIGYSVPARSRHFACQAGV